MARVLAQYLIDREHAVPRLRHRPLARRADALLFGVRVAGRGRPGRVARRDRRGRGRPAGPAHPRRPRRADARSARHLDGGRRRRRPRRRDRHEAPLLARHGLAARIRSTCCAGCSTASAPASRTCSSATRCAATTSAPLEQSGEQARAIGMGAHVVSMKKLNEHVIQKIDAAQQQLLAGQGRRRGSQRPRPDGPPARQDVAARCLPRDRRRRRLSERFGRPRRAITARAS